jgi:hypothetical protein
MEMDFARFRVLALLLLSISCGAFGYSYGWQRGQIAARQDSDFRIIQERLSALQTANAAAEARVRAAPNSHS